MVKSSIPEFRTAYDGRQKEFSDASAIDFTVPDDEADFHPSRSLTSQNEAEELDINSIMARYLKTGLMPQTRAQAFFGDASSLPDFMTAQQIILDAKAAFEGLPAKVRDRFHNSPEKFLEFMSDEDNLEEARFLGLLEPSTEALPSEAPKQHGEGKASPETSEAQE